MPVTWVLIAHRSGARLFEHKGRSTGLVLLHDIPHPEGRLKNGEINADKHGRAFDSRGAGRHAMSTSQEPVDHVAEAFARDLCQRLEQGANANRYERLVLVASPRFLGDLRGCLGDNTRARLLHTLHKDLSGINDRELPSHLSDVLAL